MPIIHENNENASQLLLERYKDVPLFCEKGEATMENWFLEGMDQKTPIILRTYKDT